MIKFIRGNFIGQDSFFKGVNNLIKKINDNLHKLEKNNLKEISKKHIGFRFIIVEGYAKAFNFYVVKNGFESLEKDEKKVENIDFISKRDPTKRFMLYFDLNRY